MSDPRRRIVAARRKARAGLRWRVSGMFPFPLRRLESALGGFSGSAARSGGCGRSLIDRRGGAKGTTRDSLDQRTARAGVGLPSAVLAGRTTPEAAVEPG